MSKAIEWFKIKIKGLELTWSDLFLAIGFLTFVPFAALSWLFMVTWDPTDIPFTSWMMITCFSISAICWGVYFFLEIRKGTIKNNLFIWAFVIFAVLSVVSVLIQPSHSTIDVQIKYFNEITLKYYGLHNIGDIIKVELNIPIAHRLFFCFGSLLITTIFFIVLFVFPKRLKNLNFLVFIGLCIFIFLLVLVTYSLVVEFDNYIEFVKVLIGKRNDVTPDVFAPKGFVAHRVPYGVCMMLGTIYALLLYGLRRKKYYLIPMFFFYLNMFFSYCKTALIITSLVLLLFVSIRLVITYKDNKKRNILAGICIYGPLLVVFVLILISVFLKGAFLPPIYRIFKNWISGRSITSRKYIWENIRNLLRNGWWLVGRGFGTYNHMLYPMNLVNGDDVCPSHSTYYAVMGAGGIINLIGFLSFYVYFGYVFLKCFKVNKYNSLVLSIGFFAFFPYSFTEGVNYLIIFFAVPLIFYYNQIIRGTILKS